MGARNGAAALASRGRPGAGEELLTRCGFAHVRRQRVPFAWEFADPDSFARALAATGPAYEAIQQVGESAFLEAAAHAARAHQRDGLPLRAEIDVVGYLGCKPAPRLARSPYTDRDNPGGTR
jgi:hypothetical protein